MAKKNKRNKSCNEFELEEIRPLTKNQEKAFDSEENLVMFGTAGCGKSFLALYFSLVDVFRRDFSKIVIIRSAVPSRDMGFLPGNDEEKAKVYELPYRSMFQELLSRGDAYDVLKKRDYVDFITTSYLRGVTLRNSYIIVDEFQNMDFGELHTIMTRVGENCKIAFCGDIKQADLRRNGMKDFIKILEKMDSFDFIEFSTEDIVRSGLVKEYIVASEEVGE